VAAAAVPISCIIEETAGIRTAKFEYFIDVEAKVAIIICMGVHIYIVETTTGVILELTAAKNVFFIVPVDKGGFVD
jgi:cytochrome b subunit of formate dehydrogenase